MATSIDAAKTRCNSKKVLFCLLLVLIAASNNTVVFVSASAASSRDPSEEQPLKCTLLATALKSNERQDVCIFILMR